MAKLTEILLQAHSIENTSSLDAYALTTAGTPFLNLMDNFEDDEITEIPSVCKLHIPTWLNLWCVFISICVLTLLIVLGVLLRFIQVQKQRSIRSEIVHGNCISLFISYCF